MAQVIHLRCRHCGEPMKNNPWPYCSPCNLALCYKAMPLLLGILMTSHITPPSTTALVASAPKKSQFGRKPYEHSRYILD